MSDYPVHTIETAPESSRPMLREVAGKLPFVPNLLGVLAGAPPALEAYLTLSAVFEKTSLDPVDCQIVLLTASRENACTYCVAAHSTVAGMKGVDRETVRALREDRALPDPAREALHRFVRAVVRNRGWVGEEDRDAFLAAGYTTAQALEILVGVSLKTLSNYANHLAETPLDTVFEAAAWRPGETREADTRP